MCLIFLIEIYLGVFFIFLLNPNTDAQQIYMCGFIHGWGSNKMNKDS